MVKHADVACGSLATCALTWLKSVKPSFLQKGLKLEKSKWQICKSYEAKNASLGKLGGHK
jgi:hypothetical protein